MNFLSKKLSVAVKCQTITGLKGSTGQWSHWGKVSGSSSSSMTVFLLLSHLHSLLPHNYISVTSLTYHCIRHALHPIHSLCSYCPLLGLVGRWKIYSLNERKKINSVYCKTDSFNFSNPWHPCDFSVSKTKLGQKSWDSSLSPNGAYLLSSGKAFSLFLLPLKMLLKCLLSSDARNYAVAVSKFP